MMCISCEAFPFVSPPALNLMINSAQRAKLLEEATDNLARDAKASPATAAPVDLSHCRRLRVKEEFMGIGESCRAAGISPPA